MINSYDYLNVKEIIPSEIEYDSILNITTRDVNSFTHGFHKYPAKFIPQIPKWAISKYLEPNKQSKILDPFCGSGTTLVEGMLAGNNVVGIDIDHLSVMISKVKTTRINEYLLKKISLWLTNEIQRSQDGEFLPECATIDHWFTKDAITKLSIIRTAIDKIPSLFGDQIEVLNIQNLLLICFSSIIRRVSNADDESQKTYVSHTKVKDPPEVFSLFFPQMDYFIDRAIKFSRATSPHINARIIGTSSADSLCAKLTGQQIDLAITSPPYIKAIDYIYNQMVELFWVGDLFQMQTQEKQNKKKKQYIGNKQIPASEYMPYNPVNFSFSINQLDENIQNISGVDLKNGRKHSYIIYKYFLDMERHFEEMAKCLNRGTHYVLVVGDSSVSGIFIESSKFLIELARRNGFEISNKWGYVIKNRFMRFDRKGRGGKIDIDWVLDFVRN